MAVPKRFGVLRLVGTLLKVVAWIILVVFVLFAILAVISGPTLPLLGPIVESINPGLANIGTSEGILLGIVALILGLIYFLVLYAVGESVHLQVALEENTRLTAALLLRMHQDSQIEGEPDYTAGYASEPFEG
jgi:hypothetical protein